jgi:hypothetical protein
MILASRTLGVEDWIREFDSEKDRKCGAVEGAESRPLCGKDEVTRRDGSRDFDICMAK